MSEYAHKRVPSRSLPVPALRYGTSQDSDDTSQHSRTLPRPRLRLAAMEEPDWAFKARKWQMAYKETLDKHGSVSVGVTRCVIIGPSAVGKSSLKHLLVHNTPKAVKTSTAVMDAPDVVCVSSEQYTVNGGTSAWQLVDSDVMGLALHECVTNQAYDEGKHHQKMEKEEDVPPSTGQRAISGAVASLEEQQSHFMAKLTEGYQVNGSEGVRLKNASFIHLLDTGGQPSFQDVLPLLLDTPCTYIHVFNAAQDWDQPVPITYRPDDHTEKVLPPSTQTGWEMLLHSLSSMQTMAHKCSKELATYLQEDRPGQLPQSRIFVVGTFKDQLIQAGRLKKATRDFNKRLRELEGQPYYRCIENDSAGQLFYLINNMGDKEEERKCVSSLREHLSSAGSSAKLKVPLTWYFFQQVTQGTRQKFFKFCDLKAFCLKHKYLDEDSADEQFCSLLHLFTHLGFFAFFDLKDVPNDTSFVCTDTGMFLKEVSKLLAVQFMKPTSRAMESFKNTGILAFSRHFFPELGMSQEMDPLWFLRALEHLGIAARLHSKDQLEYFIPAVLPQSSAIQKPAASIAPLCLTYKIKEGAVFSYNDLPRGVFCRLAVELIRSGWKIVYQENTRSLLKFYWEDCWEMLLQESPGYISLSPKVVEEMSSAELHNDCESVLTILKKCLSLSTDDALGNHFSTEAELCVGFACPCKKVKMPHLAVPSARGKSLRCTQSCSRPKYTNHQRIWFATVDEAELVYQDDLDIWTLEDSTHSEKGPDKQKTVATAPMSPWNDSALVNQQWRLMINVKLAPQLLYMLEGPAGGFMTRAEAQSVANEMSNSEQMAKVIQILRGKGNEEFRIFCKLLQKSNYGLWSDELQTAAEDFKLKDHHFICSAI